MCEIHIYLQYFIINDSSFMNVKIPQINTDWVYLTHKMIEKDSFLRNSLHQKI